MPAFLILIELSLLFSDSLNTFWDNKYFKPTGDCKNFSITRTWMAFIDTMEWHICVLSSQSVNLEHNYNHWCWVPNFTATDLHPIPSQHCNFLTWIRWSDWDLLTRMGQIDSKKKFRLQYNCSEFKICLHLMVKFSLLKYVECL
jgi:hypothetical protein